jgi:hypothetical protein
MAAFLALGRVLRLRFAYQVLNRHEKLNLLASHCRANCRCPR